MSSDPYAQNAAAYVMGALDAGDRAAYEDHLATCAACRAEVADAESVLPFLRLSEESDLDQVEEVPPLPDTLLPRLLAAERRERQRRRTLRLGLGALAAACVLVLGAVLIVGRSGAGADSRPMAAVQPTSLSATAALEATGVGTRITVHCWDRTGAAPAGYAYTLSARSRSGEVTDLGTWQLTGGQPITFTTSSSLATDQIAAIDISDTDGTTLLELKN
jgi:anti-sigma-K factor RskA